MYNIITVINERTCTNRKVNYKFSLIYDKQSNTTIAILELYNENFTKKYAGEFFFKVLEKIKLVFNLPYDPENKVYSGPELFIKLYDDEKPYEWSNLSHPKCEFDSAFYNPNFYKEESQIDTYNEVVHLLIKISDSIFGKIVN